LEEPVKLVWLAWDRRFEARVAESPDRLNQLKVVRKQGPYRLLPSPIILVDNRREILLLCRIVGPFLQNAASHGAVQSNCEHRTRRAHDRNTKTELRGTIGDSPFGVCKEHVRHPSGFGRCPIEYRPSVPYDCNPRVTMCLSGPFVPMISVGWWCVNARLGERHLEVNYEPASLLCHSQQSPIF
jgi:hypothetical protein